MMVIAKLFMPRGGRSCTCARWIVFSPVEKSNPGTDWPGNNAVK